MTALSKRLILALDTPDLESALDLVRRTKGVVGTFKVGLELYTAAGPAALKALRKEECDIFLDLKLHDIPNTVAGAVRAAARHEVAFLTIHASGGPAMLQAAQEALSGQTTLPGGAVTRLLAVTALTHLTGKDLAAVGFASSAPPGGAAGQSAGAIPGAGGHGVADVVRADDVVKRLAQLAAAAGVFGCVCSPDEAALVKRLGLCVVCPGIRAKDSPAARDDQRRTATAFEAVRDGADYVVVGRPIRSAPDPAHAAALLLEEIEAGLQARAPQ